VAVLRLLAAGRARTGETAGALAALAQLLDLDPQPESLDRVDTELSVSRPRLAQALLAELLSSAKPEERDQIDQAVAARLAAARASNDPEKLIPALRAFLDAFGCHPLAEDARDALSQGLLSTGNLLEAELHLLELADSSVEARAAAATARLALMLVKTDRPDHAAIYYAQLAGRWADVVCLDGKTGKQLVAELRDGSLVRAALAPPAAWPTGRVDVASDRSLSRPGGPANRRPVELRGESGPFFADGSLALDEQSWELIGRDALGAERFRFGLTSGESTRPTRQWNGGVPFPQVNGVFVGRGGSGNVRTETAAARGHLLVVASRSQLTALDTLYRNYSQMGPVLWSLDLSQQGSPSTVQNARTVNSFWGPPRAVPLDGLGREIGSLVSPVTRGGVVLQQFRELVCVDPLTGVRKWRRENVPQGSELFADDELLLVFPPGENRALVVRMLDGELLSERKVPSRELRVTALGRLLLAFRTEAGRPVLALRDLAADKDVWTQPCEAGCKAALLGSRAVGVRDANGNFRLWSLPEGKLLAQLSMPEPREVKAIYLIDAGATAIVATDMGVAPGWSPPAVGAHAVLVTGKLYAVDLAKGGFAWPKPFEVATHGLPLLQPRDVPLLTLFSQSGQAVAGGQRITGRVSAIDKRNGQEVYQTDDLPTNYAAPIEITGNLADRTVALSFPSKVLTLRLTDQPPPKAGEAPKVNVNKAIEAGIRAIFGPRQFDNPDEEDPFR
jgi:outer membrane protein assembly factor BamB